MCGPEPSAVHVTRASNLPPLAAAVLLAAVALGACGHARKPPPHAPQAKPPAPAVTGYQRYPPTIGSVVGNDERGSPRARAASPAELGADEPLQRVGPTQDVPPGTLVYVCHLVREHRPYVVLRHIGSHASQSGPARAYRLIAMPGNVYSPVLSPDGRRVLLQVGEVTDMGASRGVWALRLDTSNVTRLGRQRAGYARALWSPDGTMAAFVEGTDYEGVPWPRLDGMPPLRVTLYVGDARTGRSWFVAEDFSVYSMAWAPDNTLLFAARPKAVRIGSHFTDKLRDTPIREASAIHRWSPKTRKCTVVLRDASAPMPAPAGDALAFVTADGPDAYSGYVRVRLGSRRGREWKTPLLLYDQAAESQVGWTRDGKRIAVVSAGAELTWPLVVEAIEPATRLRRRVAVVNEPAHTPAPAGYTGGQPQCALLDTSPDGQWAVVRARMLFTKDTGPWHAMHERHYVLAVNLVTGRVVELAHLQGSDIGPWAVDWHFDSLPGSPMRGATKPRKERALP